MAKPQENLIKSEIILISIHIPASEMNMKLMI